MNTFVQNLVTNMVSSKIEGIAKKMWISEAAAKQAVVFAVPLIISYLSKNTSTAEAKQGLLKATQDPRNTVDQDPNDIDLWDASKMLGHIFGSDTDKALEQVSSKTDLESNQVSDLVWMLAKYVVWWLWKEKEQENLDDDGVVGLLNDANQLMNSSKTENSWGSDLLWSLLVWAFDKNKDGNYKDDLLQQGAQMLMWKLFWNGKS
jgi:hypothetical protein